MLAPSNPQQSIVAQSRITGQRSRSWWECHRITLIPLTTTIMDNWWKRHRRTLQRPPRLTLKHNPAKVGRHWCSSREEGDSCDGYFFCIIYEVKINICFLFNTIIEGATFRKRKRTRVSYGEYGVTMAVSSLRHHMESIHGRSLAHNWEVYTHAGGRET